MLCIKQATQNASSPHCHVCVSAGFRFSIFKSSCRKCRLKANQANTIHGSVWALYCWCRSDVKGESQKEDYFILTLSWSQTSKWHSPREPRRSLNATQPLSCNSFTCTHHLWRRFCLFQRQSEAAKNEIGKEISTCLFCAPSIICFLSCICH